jgi:flagellar protein FlaJ
LTRPEIQKRLSFLKSSIGDFFKTDGKRKVSKPKGEKKEGTVSSFAHASFGMLGGFAEPVLHHFEDLRPNLLKSGIKITLRSYVSLMIFLPAIAFILPFAFSLTLGVLLRAGFAGVLLVGLAIGLLCAAVSFTALYSYPSIKAGSRSQEIERELPFAVSHMAVLASAGIPPERIFRSVITVESGVLTNDLKDVVRDVDLLGKDIISALEAAADRSPSKEFSELSEGLIATVVSGGELRRYLYDKAKSLMEMKRIKGKELGEKLSIVGEMYVTMLVVFPLVLIIMFTVMASVSSTLAGISILMFMYLLAYILVPLMSVAVMVLLDSMMPKG